MCRSVDTKVIDSRAAEEGRAIRRRRECLECGHRFTTYERAAYRPLVRKRGGHLEPFSPDKVRSGIEQALADRSVATGTVEALVTQAEDLFGPETSVVSAGDIGDAVLQGLRAVDEVAYLRFASVYKEFSGTGDFEREMAAMEDPPDTEPPS
jgi:transcriptional repressor NrdR